VGDSFEERVAAFGKQSGDLRSDFTCSTEKGRCWPSWAKLRGPRDGAGSAPIASADRFGGRRFGPPVLLTDARYDAVDLEKCDAGISQCDALVAQTGVWS